MANVRIWPIAAGRVAAEFDGRMVSFGKSRRSSCAVVEGQKLPVTVPFRNRAITALITSNQR